MRRSLDAFLLSVRRIAVQEQLMNVTSSSQPEPSSPTLRVSWSSRKIPPAQGRHTCGRVTLEPAAYSVDYESHLEREAIGFLRASPGFQFLQSQPFTLHFHLDDAWGRYTPDLVAVFSSVSGSLRRLGFERWTVVEVKPWARFQVDRAAIVARLQMIRQVLGFAVVCLTERHIARQTGGAS
jgi:hypothetical protein